MKRTHTEVSIKAFIHRLQPFLCLFPVADTSYDTVAKLCRKLQRVSNNRIIFLNETHIKTNKLPRTTLVAPGEKL